MDKSLDENGRVKSSSNTKAIDPLNLVSIYIDKSNNSLLAVDSFGNEFELVVKAQGELKPIKAVSKKE